MFHFKGHFRLSLRFRVSLPLVLILKQLELLFQVFKGQIQILQSLHFNICYFIYVWVLQHSRFIESFPLQILFDDNNALTFALNALQNAKIESLSFFKKENNCFPTIRAFSYNIVELKHSPQCLYYLLKRVGEKSMGDLSIFSHNKPS